MAGLQGWRVIVGCTVVAGSYQCSFCIYFIRSGWQGHGMLYVHDTLELVSGRAGGEQVRGSATSGRELMTSCSVNTS